MDNKLDKDAWLDSALDKLDTYTQACQQSGTLMFAAKRELMDHLRSRPNIPDGFILIPIKPDWEFLTNILIVGKMFIAKPEEMTIQFAEVAKAYHTSVLGAALVAEKARKSQNDL